MSDFVALETSSTLRVATPTIDPRLTYAKSSPQKRRKRTSSRHHRHQSQPFQKQTISTMTTPHQTTMMMDTNGQHQQPQLQSKLDAVIIRNLTYEAGRGSQKKLILNKINMTVPEGSIYGLLGPSGCGKTTMLRCVVGRIRSRQGTVLVFGSRPNESGGQVPGRAVGYMPQEISIYEDFTIEETLQYFGRINRMRSDEIRSRIDFLLQFLDLPSKRRLIANLSGGQKRRVSLAAALVHSPPLLILDEPTVGVDPLLRQSIWQHLVTLTQKELISVIITTHYIEEARQANVVGLMRHGKILAEASPSALMAEYRLTNLEDVFLKLCVTDSAKKSASLAAASSPTIGGNESNSEHRLLTTTATNTENKTATYNRGNSVRLELRPQRNPKRFVAELAIAKLAASDEMNSKVVTTADEATDASYINEAIEVLSSEEDDRDSYRRAGSGCDAKSEVGAVGVGTDVASAFSVHRSSTFATQLENASSFDADSEEYVASQTMRWASRRSGLVSYRRRLLASSGKSANAAHALSTLNSRNNNDDYQDSNLLQWCKTLMAVTWKNYVRLRRNSPVLVFQFMLPAIQVILFCLCIGGEPFDVPLAVVNDELTPQSSVQFLDGLNKKVIRQIKYDNLSSALEAVRLGQVWGALHIPDKYSQNLQSRLIAGDEATNETISNGTIRVYPDLTNLHLAIALEETFRDSFINFARNSLENLGYDKSLADMPIQIGTPVYGSLKKDGYLEFMAPGVVISISYVMATGLTALAFILERRDGLLERSLVSGVQTSQILLAHAINQVVVMIIQIFMVLGCVFFVFEIPSRGPFVWVVLLILLQGCTGMGFGLLVSAVCSEENTAVMMLVGTFYTNLILAGIIWPIEAMPHWLRPLSYAQPQTLPTDSLRHILSRGWTITDPSVLLGFAVTIGWMAVFLMTAGLIFKYSG